MQPRDRLNPKEVQVATLVWQGLANKDIAGILGTSEQVVKNYLRTTFDKLGVWTRLELALYVAAHGGTNWHSKPETFIAPLATAPDPAVSAREGTKAATAAARSSGSA